MCHTVHMTYTRYIAMDIFWLILSCWWWTEDMLGDLHNRKKYRNELLVLWILSMCKLWQITHKLNIKPFEWILFLWILLMCKLRRITHKLSKEGLYVKCRLSFLIIQTLSSKSYFCRHYCTLGAAEGNSSKIHAHGIYRSVKLFIQPIKILEIGIMMRS